MNKHDETYHQLLQDVLDNGIESDDRTGTGVLSVFGRQYRYNLADSFPLITTKKIHWKSVVGELLWFLEGSTNAHYLEIKYGVTIWSEWAKEDGDLGKIYGYQWRKWTTIIPQNKEHHPGYDTIKIDQIKKVIESIKTNPNDRGHIVSAWNVVDLDDMALRPCHTMFQFYVRNGTLSCQLYQRSGDAFLGIPFNIASYALLTHMIAQVCNLKVGEFIHTIGDLHIYKNHLEQVKEQLSRSSYVTPTLKLNEQIKDIDNFTVSDIMLEGYTSHPAIKAVVAV